MNVLRATQACIKASGVSQEPGRGGESTVKGDWLLLVWNTWLGVSTGALGTSGRAVRGSPRQVCACHPLQGQSCGQNPSLALSAHSWALQSSPAKPLGCGAVIVIRKSVPPAPVGAFFLFQPSRAPGLWGCGLWDWEVFLLLLWVPFLIQPSC